jgi:glyoxylase-like metal-dependent hydrolase (beta-lactamase superfamily II)
MAQQIPLPPDARADHNEDAIAHQIAADLAYARIAIVNVVFYGSRDAGDRGWVLIDAGLPGTKKVIQAAALERFGKDARPSAIVMTHGHFDHVGALEALAEEWDVVVYAHPDEAPYLEGRKSYPPPDPKVGGGLMARASSLFPREPVNVSRRLRFLPADGRVPPMPAWRWVHTPGHTEGHVSFWRESDRALIAGDAFITTAQESVYAVLAQKAEMHGPPMYFTPDWISARESVKRLAALNPEVVVTGHGRPMRGDKMRHALRQLVSAFDEVAVPKHGRYTPAAVRPQ